MRWPTPTIKSDIGPKGFQVIIPVYQRSNKVFPKLESATIAEADSVQIIQHRGDWLQIRIASGQQGWTKAELLEQV